MVVQTDSVLDQINVFVMKATSSVQRLINAYSKVMLINPQDRIGRVTETGHKIDRIIKIGRVIEIGRIIETGKITEIEHQIGRVTEMEIRLATDRV